MLSDSATPVPNLSDNARVMRDGGAVIRIANPAVPMCRVAAVARRASLLAAAGAPVCHPAAAPALGWIRDRPAARWVDLGDSEDIDWRSYGAALRRFHVLGSVALAHEPLDVLDDTSALRTRLPGLLARGAVTAREADEIAAMLDGLDSLLDDLGVRHPASRVLVHDDLWAKNVISRGGATWLVDLDNLGWARPAYDLSFLVRGLGRGYQSRADLDDFEDGYGAGLPSAAEAWLWGSFHQAGWLFDVLDRCVFDPGYRRKRAHTWNTVFGDFHHGATAA